MKTLKLIVFGIVLFIAGSIQAQLSVNINIGSPPQWGPVGYSEARYYYLPDVESYYDVQSSRFIFYNGRAWVRSAYLPSRYRNYDLYNGYKVVMTDYRGNSPYRYFKQHKYKYAKGYRGQSQRSIGAKPGRGNSHVQNHSSSRQNNVSSGKQRNYKHGQSQGNGHGNESKNNGHGNDKGRK